MKKLFLLFFAMALFSTGAFAQKYTVTAKLVDVTNSEALAFATASLTAEKSEEPLAYALSDDNGNVSIPDVKPGKYVFKAEILGYKTVKKNIEIKASDVNLGTLKLDVDYRQLDAATISAKGNPIQMKRDTIEFTASTYKTTDNDVLEDLIKKIPGMEVSEDGSITHNGRAISKITIDGKTFFLDDPQLASKNIPAKIVQKLKVVEKKSDQAEFTGIDDGEEETVLDLSIKPGMMKGTFGNVMLGGGHDIPANEQAVNDWRYQGAAFAGKFTDKQQISLVGNVNNTNNRGFNDLSGSMMGNMRGGGGGMGRGQGGWGGGNGISKTYMGGVNGAWSLCDGRMDLGGNYLFNSTDKDVEEASSKTTFLDDSNLMYKSAGFSNSKSLGHRFGVRLDHKFNDNTSILFEPRVNFGHGSFTENSVDTTNTYWNATGLTERTNDSWSLRTGQNKNVTTSGFALLRQKLGMPGRTLTVMARYSVSGNTLDGLNNSETNTYTAGVKTGTNPINQSYDQHSNSYSLMGRATFTQPLGRNFYLEANYMYSWNKSTSSKNTVDVATGLRVDSYSNSIANEAVNQNIGFNILYQKESFRAQIGASAMPTKTHNYTANGSAYKVDTTMNVVNWAPHVMVFGELSENSNIRFFYHGHSHQPSTSQLITVADNTNPLAVSFGNPNLSPYFSHDIRGDYRYNNKKTFSSVNVRFDGSVNQNPIVRAQWYTNGITYSMPVNGPMSANANVNLFANVPIAKSNFTVSNMTAFGWSTSSSYVGKGIDTGRYLNPDGSLNYNLFFSEFDAIQACLTLNKTNNVSVRERLRVTYRSDDLEVSLSGRTRMNLTDYLISGTDPRQTTTWNNQIRATANWTWDAPGLTFKSEYNYNWYRGYDNPQPDEHVLNVEINKLLFKKKMTLALKGYDILGQSKNLTVTDTANYHSESVNNTLGRYIILSLTYRFGTFNRSRMGGPGGRRPM